MNYAFFLIGGIAMRKSKAVEGSEAEGGKMWGDTTSASLSCRGRDGGDPAPLGDRQQA